MFYNKSSRNFLKDSNDGEIIKKLYKRNGISIMTKVTEDLKVVVQESSYIVVKKTGKRDISCGSGTNIFF